MVVSGPGVNPYGLLDRRARRNLVVTVQSVDDNRKEVPFRGQQPAGKDQLPVGLLAGFTVKPADPFEVVDQIGRFPDQGALAVGGSEVQAYLGVERVVAAIVGQAGYQVMVGQQARFGDVVDRDHVVRVGGAVVPYAIGRAGVGLPRVVLGGSESVHENLSVAGVEHIVAAGSVQEIQARPAVEQIVVVLAQHAVKARIFPDDRHVDNQVGWGRRTNLRSQFVFDGLKRFASDVGGLHANLKTVARGQTLQHKRRRRIVAIGGELLNYRVANQVVQLDSKPAVVRQLAERYALADGALG